MCDALQAELFVEDRAHEALLVPLLKRLAREEHTRLSIQVRSARGGHPRALQEFRNWSAPSGKRCNRQRIFSPGSRD